MEPTKTQLPATVTQAEITSPDLGAAPVVPALIADLGYDASWRYVEFFTANIRNPHTRRAYARACSRFFAWCEQRGLTLAAIRPFDVATYIESLQQEHSAPGVKQQLAAVRMLFDWLITGQVMPANPALAVRKCFAGLRVNFRDRIWRRPVRGHLDFVPLVTGLDPLVVFVGRSHLALGRRRSVEIHEM